LRQICFYSPHGFVAYFIKHNAEGKVLLVLKKAPCHECIQGMEAQNHTFRTRWMLVVSYLTPGGGARGAQWTGGWVDPRAGQDTLENRKVPFLWWGLKHYSSVT